MSEKKLLLKLAKVVLELHGTGTGVPMLVEWEKKELKELIKKCESK